MNAPHLAPWIADTRSSELITGLAEAERLIGQMGADNAPEVLHALAQQLAREISYRIRDLDDLLPLGDVDLAGAADRVAPEDLAVSPPGGHRV